MDGKWLEKIKKIRRDQWVMLLLAGVLAAVVFVPSEKTEEPEPASGTAETSRETLSGSLDAAQMESRLERILRRMEGAGEVLVMITQKDSGEKIVEKDVSAASRTTQEQDGGGTSRSTVEQENQESTVYGADGGDDSPYVTRELAPQVEGVLVLAEGADDANVKKEITDAVMALFGLEAHKIKVVKMNERRG